MPLGEFLFILAVMMPMRVLSRWRQSVAALLPEGIILEALIIALVLLLLDLL